ncbi:MAG: DUF4268 domain-containing protein [Bacteroidetes bacterium]|nr:DUF4268 domain-containing protein [Bacteroidota bacterium]
MTDLATLESVSLRDIWKDEAQDFTPWLEKNIHLLFEEIGISGENIEREKYTGRLYVDITAKESDTGKKIIIENQLNRTDHDHLGKLLTYASRFDASIIIWIVSEITEEHQRAIEWFNDHMDDEIAFFLIKIEVYCIEDSKRAPKFNVIVEPKFWPPIPEESPAATDTQLKYLDFWNELKDYASHSDIINFSLRHKSKPQSWFDVSIGSSEACIRMSLSAQKNRMSGGIIIHNSNNLFEFLREHKDTFEKYVDDKIQWLLLEGKQSFKILCTHEWYPDNEDLKQKYYEWMLQLIQKFYNAFKQIYKEYKSKT